ncbi:MAG: EF-hand domain-containing protein [Pseudomonadota bacterium]
MMKKTPLLILTAALALGAAQAAYAHEQKGEGGESGWSRMDQDGDGAISRQEFASRHEEKFARADANKDGKVTAEERTAMREEMQKRMEERRKKMHEHMQERMQDRMAEVDTNKDGVISKAEHKAYVDKKFAEMDKNGDGKLTREEMRAGMKMMHDGDHDMDGMMDGAKKGG